MSRARWPVVLLTMLVPAIFAADLATSYEFHLSDLYCVIVLIASHVAGPRIARAIASAAVLLTLASMAAASGPLSSVITSGVISIILLGAVVLFVSRGRSTIPPRDAVREDARTLALEGQGHDDTARPNLPPLLDELRQPLSVLLSDGRACLRWLKREQPDLSEAMQCAQRMVTNAARAGDLLTSLNPPAIRGSGLASRRTVSATYLPALDRTKAGITRPAARCGSGCDV